MSARTCVLVVTTTDAFGGDDGVRRARRQTIANVEDEATGTLLVTGTAQEGGSLTADTSGLADVDGGISSYAYQWQELIGAVWTDIAGETTDTLSIPDDQSYVGKDVRLEVTTTDAFGGETVFESAAETIANVEDEATGTLLVTGTAQEGGSLTADTSGLADVDGGISSYAYQWQELIGAVWTDIAGETTDTLSIPDDQSYVGKDVRLEVTTTDAFGGETVFESAAETIANVEDEATGTLLVTGTAQEGGSLTADTSGLADVDGGISSYAYQWQELIGAVWTDIAGETTDTLSIPDDQSYVGKDVRLEVTTTDAFGGETVFESAAETIANVEDEATGTLLVTGTAQEGGSLTADTSGLADVDGGISSYAYQWQELIGAVWTDIAGETTDTLSIPDDQSYVGKDVRLEVTTTDAFGGETVFESAAETIANVEDEATGTLLVTGTAQEGGSLTADTSGLADVDGGISSYAYQWQELIGAVWTDIAGETTDTLSIPDDQSYVGKDVRLEVTTTDAFGGETVFESAAETIANVEDEATGTLLVTGTAQEGGSLTADTSGLADVDGGISSYAYQWQELIGAVWTDIAGETTDTLSIPDDQSYVGKDVRLEVTTTDAFGGETVFESAAETIANVEDEATGTLLVTGTAQEGGSLTADTSGLADVDGGISSYAYQWQELIGAVWTDIAGETTDTLSIPDDQSYVGKDVRLEVTTTDAFGGETVFESAAETIANVEDEATGTLLVTGTAQEGGSLTADTSGLADVDGGISSYAYQWQELIGAVWTDIAGETTDTLSIPDDQSYVGKDVRLEVTTTDAFGGETVFESAAETIANVEDEATGTLLVTGTAQEGGSLTADTSGLADVDGGISSYAYQWQELIGAVWTDIAGETTDTLSIPDDQSYVGKDVRLEVTTTDAFGGETVFESAAETIANVEDEATGTLLVTGTAQEGGSLTADTSGLADVDGGISSYAYQWQELIGAVWTDIAGETTDTLSIPDDQSYVGKDVRLEVTTTDAFGGETVFESAAETIANVEDEATGTLLVTGTAQEGGSLTADTSGLADVDGGISSYAYQWQELIGAVWTDIAGETTDTLSIPDDQSYVGKDVRLEVTTTDAFGGETATSVAVGPVANVNDVPIAQNDIATTTEDHAPILINVVGNDTDADFDALTPVNLSALSNPSLGSLTIVGNQVRFTPAANASGSASFTYQASDGLTTSNVATVTVDVAPVADTPTLSIDPTPRPIAGEFRTNTTTANYQELPTTTALSNGGFVVVWVSASQEFLNIPGNFPADGVIQAQRYDANGAPIGAEFHVGSQTTNQNYPGVSPLADGGFLVTWAVKNGIGQYDVMAQRFNAAATPLGAEFQVNTTTTNDQAYASTASLADGGFVVMWATSEAGHFDIKARRYDSSGTAITGEILVNTTTAGQQSFPSISPLADGGFVVTWSSFTQFDHSDSDVYARRYSASGTPTGAEFLVNTHTPNTQIESSSTGLANGGFLITWSSVLQDGSGSGIYGQRYDADGSLNGTEFRINGTTLNDQVYSAPVALADGGFIVTWTSFGQDGSDWGVYGQRFDAAGAAYGNEFRLSQSSAGVQKTASGVFGGTTAVVLDNTDTLVQVWSGSPSVIGDESYGRLFSVPGIGEEDTAIGLPAITAGVTDPSETLVLKLFGYPAGATFSKGAAGVGADAGKWIISSPADIASLAATPLTMMPPPDFHGTFTLSVEAQVTDSAMLSTVLATDTTSVTQTMLVTVVPVPAPIAGPDTVLTNVASGSNIVIPGWALLANDTDPQNDPLSIGLVGSAAVNDAVSLSSGNVIYIDNSPQDGSFTYTASDGTDQSAMATATVDTQAGATIAGTAANEILIGTGGGETLNAGGGNDHLFGNAGNDALNGGAGNDVYGFAFTGDGNDTITEAGGVGGGTDSIVIATNGAAFTDLSFDHVDGVAGGETALDDLRISYNGQSILFPEYFQIFGAAAFEQVLFSGGASLYGYSIQATPYYFLTAPHAGTVNHIFAGADGSGNYVPISDFGGDDILFGHNNGGGTV